METSKRDLIKALEAGIYSIEYDCRPNYDSYTDEPRKRRARALRLLKISLAAIDQESEGDNGKTD